MSKCHNTNTTEFVALEKAFKSKFKANSIATKWQAITSLDRLPTIDEASDDRILDGIDEEKEGDGIFMQINKK